MRNIKLKAVIEEDVDDENHFVSWCPEIGVASHGDSREHALEMIKEAVELHLEGMTDKEIRQLLKENERNMQTITVPIKPKRPPLTQAQRHALEIALTA